MHTGRTHELLVAAAAEQAVEMVALRHALAAGSLSSAQAAVISIREDQRLLRAVRGSVRFTWHASFTGAVKKPGKKDD